MSDLAQRDLWPVAVASKVLSLRTLVAFVATMRTQQRSPVQWAVTLSSARLARPAEFARYKSRKRANHSAAATLVALSTAMKLQPIGLNRISLAVCVCVGDRFQSHTRQLVDNNRVISKVSIRKAKLAGRLQTSQTSDT